MSLSLKGLLSKIREKRAYIESAKDLIKRRYNEIDQVEKKVHEDIKQFASKLFLNYYFVSFKKRISQQIERDIPYHLAPFLRLENREENEFFLNPQ